MSKSHANYNPNAKNVVINNNDDNTDQECDNVRKQRRGGKKNGQS